MVSRERTFALRTDGLGASRGRRNGSRNNGFYLLLGSASLDLIQRSSETLAGRNWFIELSGLHQLEVPAAPPPGWS
jgi:hypothetical protein